MKKIGLIGSGAREHAIARAIAKSKQPCDLYCFSGAVNPGIKALSEDYATGDVCDFNAIWGFVEKEALDFVIIGPEAPLEAGVADRFWKEGIPVIGPKQLLAQIETSKGFARTLLKKFKIDANPVYQVFNSMEGVQEFFASHPEAYVIKADGLMGGKGVKVFGDHLTNDAEAMAWCEFLVAKDLSFVLEEKLIGQEFSLISFCDGEHVVHCPVVADHKRAFLDDTGPNTGGMGSLSDADHRLPFITDEDVTRARDINEQTAKALRDEFGEPYIGFLYGGFIATQSDVKLIEYNARLGDPEAMNILTLLESDFVEICLAMIEGSLSESHAIFSDKATVCKYAVPEGYPDKPVKGKLIDVSAVHSPEHLFLAAVDETDAGLIGTGSRTAAVVGVADTITEAEKMAEAEIARIKGPLYHREDIGTHALLQKRISFMQSLRDESELRA